MFQRLKETGKHTLTFGVGGMLQQAISFVLLPVYTRYLTPADYGVLNLLMIAGLLTSMIPWAVVGPSLFRSYYDYETEEERSLAVSTGFFLSTAITGVLLLIGVLFSHPLSMLLTGDSEYAMLTAIMLLGSALSTTNKVALVVFRAQKWSFKYTVVSTGSLFVSLGMTIYLVVFRRLNIAGVVFGSLAGNVVSAFLSLWMVRGYLRLAASRVEIRKMVSYGLPFIPADVISFTWNSADRLIIQAFFGPSAVGLYALAWRLGQLVSILVVQPFSLIEPAIIFSGEEDPRAKEFYARLLTYFLLVTTLVGLGVSLVANDVLRLMTSSEYWAAGHIVPWISLASVLYGARTLVSVGLALKRQTRWFPVSLAIGLALHLCLMFALLPVLGILGAGVSLSIGYLGMCVFRYVISQRIYSVSLEIYRLLRILIAALVLFWFGKTIDIVGMSILMSLTLKFVIVVVGFPILLSLMNFQDPTEVATVRELKALAKQRMKLVLSAGSD